LKHLSCLMDEALLLLFDLGRGPGRRESLLGNDRARPCNELLKELEALSTQCSDVVHGYCLRQGLKC